MNARYAKVRIHRKENEDGQMCFSVLLNDQEDGDLGINFFPEGFEIGEEATIICIHDIHLREQPW